jgi:hypothetical protein
MKLVKTFSRRLKTARRFVFENIMDLEHVCVLHRRWFRDLRIRDWTPDYVDYRLRSDFYGLTQETHVRGARVDADRYWYEFNGSLARIRVDGHMMGPDGGLTLTEQITYDFHWALAPLFWTLSPLFRWQKEDILRDDSRLLERLYELDQAGFERSVDTGWPRVVVYGGSGFFGRLVVRELLQHSDAQIMVASRQPKVVDSGPQSNRVRFYESDLRDAASVQRLIAGAAMVICAAGPYQGMPLDLLEACIACQVHYVDVADDRDFVVRAHALRREIEAAGITALVGCSVVPGLSALLTKLCAQEIGDPARVRIFITPGTRHTRGPGSLECLLATVGERYTTPTANGGRTVRGWTGRERVQFPQPLNERHVYSIVDIADYYTQPLYFGVKTVEFKIGAESDALNRGLALFREAKRFLPGRSSRELLPWFRRVISCAGWFGSTRGALMVEVTSQSPAGPQTMSLAAYMGRGGERIPAVVPALAARQILDGKMPGLGLGPLTEWIGSDELGPVFNG